MWVKHSRQAKGFWFQLNDADQQQAKRPWGPLNPQALNRYSYVLNNPLRYTDPTGHCVWDLCIVEAVTVGTVIVTVAGYVAILYYNIQHPIVPRPSTPTSSGNTGAATEKGSGVLNIDPKTKVKDILKNKKGTIKNAPLPSGSPSWDDVQDMTWEDIEKGAQQDKPGYKTLKKLLSDKRFDK